MMRLGIFAKTFARPTLEATLDAVRSCGFECVQFNMACAGLASLPDQIDLDLCHRVRRAFAERKIEMAAVSGTFNMIHPVAAIRRDGLNRLRILAEACGSLGTRIITLCTGTRDLDDMWRRHPDNDSTTSFRDLTEAMKEAIRVAEETEVTLAFEPEVANVVDSAKKARQLLDEMGSPRLKVVMDAANLFHEGELARQMEIMAEAFDLLGNDIVLAHAKDLSRDGEAGHEAVGTGLLDYNCYLRSLRSCGFDGPLVLHGLREDQIDECVVFLRQKIGGLESKEA
jgi:sugar phosphate isomerase/epimerase